jgi:hypothetical protein
MSALEKLDGLMAGLKAIEHDRWDTAALAVLEMAKRDVRAVAGLPDATMTADVLALKAQTAQMAEQLKVIGEAVTALLNAPTPAVSEPAPQPAAAAAEPAPAAPAEPAPQPQA